MNLPSRYQPTGKHFSGGQGVVLVWKDTSLGREVAVKMLATRGIGGSLRKEAALLGTIKSKHVVELFEIGKDSVSGKDYMIMEYVAGADLTLYTPQDVRELLLTLFQIASGVTDIHAVNCVHRDLKPDNLKRDGADIIKIIDFGIGGTNPVNTNLGRGTDGYRAPEYYSTPIRIDQAADVYSLGVIAHGFCFGTLHPALVQIPPQLPPSLSTATICRSKLPNDVSLVLDRCLSATASARPRAAEVKAALAKHLLRNKHIADFVHGGIMYSVSQSKPKYQISATKGTFEVTYSGVDFVLTSVSGEVYVNGIAATPNMILPGSCVIGIGGGSAADRAFIPFNVSHPEVIL